jgi:hypothetical protein
VLPLRPTMGDATDVIGSGRGLDTTATPSRRTAATRKRRSRVGAEYPVTLCDLGIFMDEAAEPVPSQDPDTWVHKGVPADNLIRAAQAA